MSQTPTPHREDVKVRNKMNNEESIEQRNERWKSGGNWLTWSNFVYAVGFIFSATFVVSSYIFFEGEHWIRNFSAFLIIGFVGVLLMEYARKQKRKNTKNDVTGSE
jgi:hypothetical protein